MTKAEPEFSRLRAVEKIAPGGGEEHVVANEDERAKPCRTFRAS